MKRSILAFLSMTLSTVTIADEKVVTEIYNDAGKFGEIVEIFKDDGTVQRNAWAAWNNRRPELNETVKLNEHRAPVELTITGVSPFGAKLDESFKLSDGMAQWSSRADTGDQKAEEDQFYLALDGMTVTDLTRALYKAPFNEMDLLPSGSAKLEKLVDHRLTNDQGTANLALYTLSGVDQFPMFVWLDDDGKMFAEDWGGSFTIRQGFNRKHFEELKKISDKHQVQYYLDQSKRLTANVSQPIYIKNANLVNVDNGRVETGVSVLVENKRVKAVGPSVKAPANAKIIDADGRYLVPGLWDMHGHIGKTDAITNLAFGITSVRDIGNSPAHIEEIEGLVDQGLMATHLFKGGFIDRDTEYAAGVTKIKTLQEGLDKIDWFADNGYVQIKTYSSLKPEWAAPMAEHAHKRGLRISGHVPAFMTAEQAVRAGYDEIQHINMLYLNFIVGTEGDTRQQIRFTEFAKHARDLDLNSQEVKDFVQLLADRGTEVDLTAAVFDSMIRRRDRQVDPLIASFKDHLPANSVRAQNTAEMMIDSAETDKAYQESAQAMRAFIKMLHDAGVPIIPGTDAWVGVTLHRELEIYSESGIPNMEVIQIATINSAKVVGKDREMGSIAPGKFADIVLVDGNPVENIENLRNAALVISGDKMYQPSKILTMLGYKPFSEAIALSGL